MSTRTAEPTRLLPQQTRLIHAHDGMRLRVLRGRIWLTQPLVAQDLFLVPGDSVDLRQDWVVVGADAEPRPAPGAPEPLCEYLLEPLVPVVQRAPRRWPLASLARLRRWWQQRGTRTAGAMQ